MIEPDAKSDIRVVRDYYAAKSEHLSARFRDELNQVFEFLTLYPESSAIAFGKTRLKTMRHFPYVIGYVLVEDVVHVTGVQFGAVGWDEFEKRQG